jgi:putative tryptophan/tyrosine transport system substrate-binding protein
MTMRRREFIALLVGAAAAWPLAARAQQAAGDAGNLVSSTAQRSLKSTCSFQQGSSEAGYSRGQERRD